MATENLIPMTVRLDGAVNAALAVRANASGQEIADYAADVLTRDVAEVLKQLHPDVADRIQAELELKRNAIKYARDQKFDESITLKVFQYIRETPELCALYVQAIGGKSPYDRGNHIQARFNRSLGSAIKIAVGAVRKIDEHGNVLKAQVTKEFILTYTLLELDPSKKHDA